MPEPQMQVERRDNGDVVLADAQGRPMLKLQAEGPCIATSSTGQMFDCLNAQLTTEAVEAVQGFCEVVLDA